MVQLTREGLLFAIQHQVLTVDNTGTLVLGIRTLGSQGKLGVTKDSETAVCIKKAAFVGRWFASVPNPIAFLALWGIKLQ